MGWPLAVAAVVLLTTASPSRYGIPPTREEAFRVLGSDLGPPLFSFAVFADVQYGTMKPSGMRYYKMSIAKMEEMAAYLKENEQGLSFIVHLGDLTQDKGSYRNAVLKPLDKATPLYHVLGNHDFIGAGSVEEVMAGFNMRDRHYVIPSQAAEDAGYRLIVVDATHISTFGNKPGSKEHGAALALSSKLKASRQQHWKDHNGGVGDDQIEWLDGQLADACRANRTAVLFTHSPLLTGLRNNDMHTWDRDKLLGLLEKHRCAKVWVSGHVHVHRHVTYYLDDAHHAHLWTTSGMVQTPNNSFVVVDVYRERLLLRGVSWGTSFCKYFNLTGPLGTHGYDYEGMATHYLSRTHLSSRKSFDAAPSELYGEGRPRPAPVHAHTLQPNGKAFPGQIAAAPQVGAETAARGGGGGGGGETVKEAVETQ
eukprot:Rhum_TRINITY_DN16562_c0_g1::Rhum_TRINITY_DN16562_c0_g1_i1::g.163644::m.163644/K01517/ADPRM; manganese-dependent ADP-ribose/CDP-alcohol diphosphatase